MPPRLTRLLYFAMAANREFADYCCELLSSAGPCVPKRMFGGWGISTGGLTIGIIADLGSGDKLWLKADDATRGVMEAAGCERFTYTSTKNGEAVTRGMNYYSAPEDAMEAPHAMAHWARIALDCALKAKASPAKTTRIKSKPTGKTKMPKASGAK